MSEFESSSNGVYFLSLELENVRCFGKKQKLDLSNGNGNPARWTVILGDNGVGKTTLLEVLAEYKLPYIDYIIARFIRKNTECFNLKHSFAYDNKLENKNSKFEVESVERTFKLKQSESEFYASPIYTLDFLKDRFFAIYFYGAARKLNENRRKSETVKLLYEHGIREPYDELINAEAWLLETHHIANINSKFNNRFELIKNTLIKLLSDVTDIKVYFPDENKPELKIRFLVNNIWLSLDDLSLGYQSMTAWVVDLTAHLFKRYPNSPNPIAEPAVVLIDEIDLHLHPKWQREIMRYLSERFINTQFIVTAHSPLIVQAAEDENANIVVLQRKGDEIEIKQDFKAFHGWRVDQLLASDLFDNQPSRSSKNEELLKERDEILNKPDLSESDKKRLEELRDIPMAESPEDIEA